MTDSATPVLGKRNEAEAASSGATEAAKRQRSAPTGSPPADPRTPDKVNVEKGFEAGEEAKTEFWTQCPSCTEWVAVSPEGSRCPACHEHVMRTLQLSIL